jgi:chitosanase
MSSPYNGPFDPEKWRPTIWSITSIFESGKPEGDPAMYQTYDSGIVSYGKHQATLASGTLSLVLDEYYARSESAVKYSLLQHFDGRVKAKDDALRDDDNFKSLLIQAAAEQAMLEAQDSIFGQYYYHPAILKAQQCNLTSPLGLAITYDTLIQGGWKQVLARVATKLGGNVVGQNGITEEQWITTFLDEREPWLYEIAQHAEDDGDAASAKALRISTFRVRELKALAQAGNYGLAGPFKVRGLNIPGLPVPPQPVADSLLLDTNASTDLMVIQPGIKFTVTWNLRNCGTLAWEEDFHLVNIANTPNRAVAKRDFPLAEVTPHLPVATGEEVIISITLRAPRTGREHRGEWQLADPSGNLFGAIFPVELEIHQSPIPL